MGQRLIDANKLVLRFEYGIQADGLLFVPFRDMQKSVKRAPTVDAVPVVRCRDCVKRGTGECPMEQDYPWISTESDAFCSQGERRDDNDGEP